MSRRLLRLLALVAILLQGSGGAIALHRAMAHRGPGSAAAHAECAAHSHGEHPASGHAPASAPSKDDCPTCQMLGTVKAAVSGGTTVLAASTAPTVCDRAPSSPAAHATWRPDGARAPPASI